MRGYSRRKKERKLKRRDNIMANITQSSAQLTQAKSAVSVPNPPRTNIVAAILFLLPLIPGTVLTVISRNPLGVILGLIAGLLLAQSPKVAKQWEKAVVLRLGRYVGI